MPVERSPDIAGAVGGTDLDIGICTICNDDVGTCDNVNTTCGHIFHLSCLRRWLESSQTCPVCRQTCTADSLMQNRNFSEESGTIPRDRPNTRLFARQQHGLTLPSAPIPILSPVNRSRNARDTSGGFNPISELRVQI